MNKYFLLFGVFALFFVACKSKEDKANELIRAELNKTLYDFSSYEPIETIIDSSFSSIYRDSIILSYAYEVQTCMELSKELVNEVNRQIEFLALWSDSYSSYGRIKFNDAKEKANASFANAQLYMKKVTENRTLLKKEINQFESKFCGYQAKHKFRCKTKAGNFDIVDYLFIIDKKFEKILSVHRLNDDDFENIKEIIDEVKNEKITVNQ